MTRSVEELRCESERNRAQLAATVDRLREQITDTAEDLRYKVSPQGIKSEVSEFVSRKTHSWLDALKQQAMENPMQAIAAGTAVAVPALRLARGFPLPLLMIGAGLALTSKSMRARAADAAAPAVEKVKEMAGEAAERVQSFGEDAVDAASQAGRRATDRVSEAQARAAGIANDLSDRAARTTDRMKAGLDAASETAKAKIEQVRSTVRDKATAAPETARQMIGDNAAVIAGLGVAIGAIIAASLPAHPGGGRRHRQGECRREARRWQGGPIRIRGCQGCGAVGGRCRRKEHVPGGSRQQSQPHDGICPKD